jgi:hypothetical protein
MMSRHPSFRAVAVVIALLCQFAQAGTCRAVESREFYRLRVRCWSTSVFARLTIANASSVLTARLVGIDGEPRKIELYPNGLTLQQSMEAAHNGHQIAATVDFAVAADAVPRTLQCRLAQGALNSSSVRFYKVSGDRPEELKEVTVRKDSTNQNTRDFTVDLDSLRGTSPRQVNVAATGLPKMVWAHYYLWYSEKSWSSPQLRDHPQPRYVSSDRATIERQVKEAQQAGIDGFLASWWGPGDPSDRNLKTLFAVARERSFKVAITLESLKHNKPRDERELTAWLDYALRTYREQPALMRIDGKPLILVWASDQVPLTAWERIFAGLRRKGLDATYMTMGSSAMPKGYNLAPLKLFAGLYEYNSLNIPDPARTMAAASQAAHNYALLADSHRPALFAATVAPGYDERLIPGRPGRLKERADGGTYRELWQAALASRPDFVFITSWNEWWENTYIEPGERYGNTYLELTRELIREWKQ